VSGEPAFLRYGVKYSLQIVIFEPLFEESNRCRRLIVSIARLLEAKNIGSVIPFLPGTGESLTPISEVRLNDWRSAAKTAIESIDPTVIASFRGGSLLDTCGEARGHWRFSPETGARIVRDLRRTQLAGGDSSLFAGHALSEEFLEELTSCSPENTPHLRVVSLETDAMTADVKLPGAPLWRRAEPGDDPQLATALAKDLVDWTMQCAAS
jgi:hypothetical protein